MATYPVQGSKLQTNGKCSDAWTKSSLSKYGLFSYCNNNLGRYLRSITSSFSSIVVQTVQCSNSNEPCVTWVPYCPSVLVILSKFQ